MTRVLRWWHLRRAETWVMVRPFWPPHGSIILGQLYRPAGGRLWTRVR